MSIGKVGVSYTRTLGDNNFGSYKISSWSEEEYESDEDRQRIIAKLLKENKTVVASESQKAQVMIDYKKLNGGK